MLGDLEKGDYGNLPLLNFVRYLHSLTVLGWSGNRLIEIVAGWALILVVTGVFAAVLVFFLAATGLPWSGFWGEHFKNGMNAAGLGYPDGFWFPVAESSVPLRDVVTPTAWALENVPVPASGAGTGPAPAPGTGPGLADIGIDAAVERFEDLGIHAGYTVAFPLGPTGVYTASVVPEQVAGVRAIHLDRFSGEVLFDARYEDLGVAARLIELGTSIHMGEELGRVNQLLMLFACLSILVMAAAAVTMWWARRPTGWLGAPPYPADLRIPRAILVVAVAFGLVFPLVGLSIVVMLAIDAIAA